MQNWESKEEKKADPYFPIFWLGQKRANKHCFLFKPNGIESSLQVKLILNFSKCQRCSNFFAFAEQNIYHSKNTNYVHAIYKLFIWESNKFMNMNIEQYWLGFELYNKMICIKNICYKRYQAYSLDINCAP